MSIEYIICGGHVSCQGLCTKQSTQIRKKGYNHFCAPIIFNNPIKALFSFNEFFNSITHVTFVKPC